MYLTGATLFLSLILSRVFYILLDFIRVQDELNEIQGKGGKGGKGAVGGDAELRKRVTELEAELKVKTRDLGG